MEHKMTRESFLITDPLEHLPPTARLIAETTRRLLVEHGFSALTLENIARECGLNKATIPYYFGNKAGLLEVVVDALCHDNMVLLSPLMAQPYDPDHLHAFTQAKIGMSENRELYLALFELLPTILRDADYGERIVGLYEWLTSMYASLFGPHLGHLTAIEVRSFSRLIIAVVDGLGIQHAIDGERFPAASAFAMLEEILGAWFERHQAQCVAPLTHE